MSREVIILPAFIGLVALWWLALRAGVGAPWSWSWSWSWLLPVFVLVGAVALWY